MKKQNAGITLIALVITIVVLLILAGITINLTIGQDGIITRAKEAEKQYKIAQIREEIEFKIFDKKINNENLTENEYVQILEQYGEVKYGENNKIIGVKISDNSEILLDEQYYRNVSSNSESAVYVDNAKEQKINNLSIRGNIVNGIKLGNNSSFDIVIIGKNMLKIDNNSIDDRAKIENDIITLNGQFIEATRWYIPLTNKFDIYYPYSKKSSCKGVFEYLSGNYTRGDGYTSWFGLALRPTTNANNSGYKNDMAFVFNANTGSNYSTKYSWPFNDSVCSLDRNTKISLGFNINMNNLNSNDVTFNNYKSRIMIVNSEITDYTYEAYKERRYTINLVDIEGNSINGIGDKETLKKENNKWIIESKDRKIELCDETSKVLDSITIYDGVSNLYIKDEIVPSDISFDYLKY